jgi:hypothetical protein
MKTQFALAIALAASLVTPLAASAQPYGGGMMMHHGDGRSASGRIASVQGSSFTLDNGRTVFLKNGTQINGGHLHPGAFVNVSGFGAGNHNINATVVTIIHHHH